MKSASKTTPSQRHSPTVTKKGSENSIRQSITLITSIHIALSKLSQKEHEDYYFFAKARSIFADSRHGVYHAGGFLSQHLLVIGGPIGIFAIEFCTFGFIGEPTTRKHLTNKYNLFQDSADVETDSTSILRALSFYLNEIMAFCENNICKEI
eukprot:12666339-Ditylum_brightwellii.AAC.1